MRLFLYSFLLFTYIVGQGKGNLKRNENNLILASKKLVSKSDSQMAEKHKPNTSNKNSFNSRYVFWDELAYVNYHRIYRTELNN